MNTTENVVTIKSRVYQPRVVYVHMHVHLTLIYLVLVKCDGVNNRISVYIHYQLLEVNVSVLGKGLELLSANGGRFEINQLLFADDTALVADSEEKLC